MKRIHFIFFLVIAIASQLASAQTKTNQYGSIEEAGWSMKDFTLPINLTEADTGKVNYLLTFNRKGAIKRIEVLSNTFSKEAELKWCKQVSVTRLSMIAPAEKVQYKGTLLLERQRCNQQQAEGLIDLH